MKIANNILSEYYGRLTSRMKKAAEHPEIFQDECFAGLLKAGRRTSFGKEHDFVNIRGINSFRRNVPIREYDDFVPYIDRIRKGEDYVLWDQKVKWFAQSSGTSSGKSKFIPITPDSLNLTHYGGFKRMILSYLLRHPDSKILSGAALTLGGSVKPDVLNGKGIFSGDLSAVLLKNSPAIVELIRTPKRETALMEDFDGKVERICRESTKRNVTSFSGVPSWNLIMLERVLRYTGKKDIREIWPNLELFMHGGINFAPYKKLFEEIISGEDMHYLENYNASEGYFAFQDDENNDSMLLTTDNGIFYEFIPMNEFDDVMSGRRTDIPLLGDVSEGINYAMVISTCGGLYRYLIGDCVTFSSTRPYRIKITGRTKLYINAFGEELMIGNAEKAIAAACEKTDCTISNYTVHPVFMNNKSKGRHEWLIEFAKEPADPEKFAEELDRQVALHNSDYEAKRRNNATMLSLKMVKLKKGTFYKWMEQKGKIGGQNKVPRLCRDSKIANELIKLQ
ncbi:MAG: GH3 auxin-responsive promoter family protein [Bacteroidales bacterium]|jgi:hypothetical protein|nr:GH3 auxin-responsive promoter family protein [Bacteroidales bacterium]